MTTCKPAVPSAMKAMPLAMCTSWGATGSSKRVRNEKVSAGSTTFIKSAIQMTPTAPTSRASPEPLTAMSVFGAWLVLGTSVPLIETRLSGSDTSTVANPPRKLTWAVA